MQKDDLRLVDLGFLASQAGLWWKIVVIDQHQGEQDKKIEHLQVDQNAIVHLVEQQGQRQDAHLAIAFASTLFFLCLEFFLYRLSFSQSNRQEDKGFYQQNNFLTSPDWDEFVMSVFYSAAIAAFVVLVVCILLYFVVAMIEGQLSFDLICQLLPWLWNLSKGERLRLFAEKLPGAAAC